MGQQHDERLPRAKVGQLGAGQQGWFGCSQSCTQSGTTVEWHWGITLHCMISNPATAAPSVHLPFAAADLPATGAQAAQPPAPGAVAPALAAWNNVRPASAPIPPVPFICNRLASSHSSSTIRTCQLLPATDLLLDCCFCRLHELLHHEVNAAVGCAAAAAVVADAPRAAAQLVQPTCL